MNQEVVGSGCVVGEDEVAGFDGLVAGEAGFEGCVADGLAVFELGEPPTAGRGVFF